MVDNGTAGPKVVYPTFGVHNPPKYSPCACVDCLYARGPGEPSDPLYPLYWSAKWTMYRVFNNYVDNPPPYDGKPPASLKEGVDYQVSYGASYYDSAWRGPKGEEGAMMEYYDEWSLPIFPMDNHFSSAFISLGDSAYFLTFDKDRPKGMLPICLFSDLNHPPRRDFIKHLPYSAGDSQRLGGRVQGYSFWTNPEPDKRKRHMNPSSAKRGFAAKWRGEQPQTTRAARAMAPKSRAAEEQRPNRASVLPRA